MLKYYGYCQEYTSIRKGKFLVRTELVSQEKNIVVVKASFTTEEVTKAVNKTFKKLSNKSNIKGFRKGHVPAKTIELYFGKKAIYAETLEDVLSNSIDEIIKEYDLKIIADPDLNPSEIEENQPYEFTVAFEVSPEVILPKLDTIEAEKIIYTPTEQMLNDNVVRILEAHSEVVPTYEEREVKKDDYVSVKYTSNIVDSDGTIKEMEKDQKIEINIGQDNMRPEITKELVGKKPGEKVVVNFPVEKDNEHKELAGKAMRYDLEISGIMTKKTPELNDETVLKITQGQNKTVAEFKEEVMKQLKASANMKSAETLNDSAIDQIMDKTTVEIPESLIERERTALIEDQEARIKRESGMTMEEFFEKSGVKKDEFNEEIKDAAYKIVKRSLIFDALAENNNINWTNEDIETELRNMAMTSRIDYKKLREHVFASRDRVYEIAMKARNRKIVNFVIKKVKVKEIAENFPDKIDEAKKQSEVETKQANTTNSEKKDKE